MTKNMITTVGFHGAKLIARRGDTSAETLVAMKPVVEGMGLDWGGQHKKLMAYPVLSPCISVTGMQMPGFEVPATAAAKICALVAKTTATTGKGE